MQPNKDIKWDYMILLLWKCSFCIHLKCFCSNLWYKQSTSHFCPYCIASHHQYKIFLCFGDVWIIWGRASKLRETKAYGTIDFLKEGKVYHIGAKIVSLWSNIKVAYWRCFFFKCPQSRFFVKYFLETVFLRMMNQTQRLLRHSWLLLS